MTSQVTDCDTYTVFRMIIKTDTLDFLLDSGWDESVVSIHFIKKWGENNPEDPNPEVLYCHWCRYDIGHSYRGMISLNHTYSQNFIS